MPQIDYSRFRDTLLQVARDAIRYGLDHGAAPALEPEGFPEPVREPGACFVTLTIEGELRGCIGSLEAHRPLVADVASNAYAAAFSDPRFMPVSEAELPRLHIHISILKPSEPMTFNSEQDLIAQLRPGVDGLIFQAGGRRSTFLPAVWESLGDPVDFLRHLKYKAGLPPDYWSDDVRVWRYTTESVE